jgi:hypothetical protein
MDSRISAVYAAFSRAVQGGVYNTGAPPSSFWGGGAARYRVRRYRFNPRIVARIIPAGIKNVLFKNLAYP